MATAAKKEVITSAAGVGLNLTIAEAATLVAYLDTSSDPGSFRRDNPELYDIQNVLEGALA
jgi:hypothetical protein